MGMFGIFVFVFSLVHADSSAATNSEIKIIKLRDAKSVNAEYCRVETGLHYDELCGMPPSAQKMDVIYVPNYIGKRMEANARDAYSKKLFYNLDKVDFFHGHFMSKGPGLSYETVKAFFEDIQVTLYHSKEYLNTWESIDLDSSPFVPHPDQRSFVGSMIGSEEAVTNAIDLIRRDLYPEPYPVGFLRGYKSAGTIYSDELNNSQHYSEQPHTSFGGSPDLYVNTCEAGEANCKPCRIFGQAFMVEQADGRYTSPDGKVFDIAVHCRYDNY